jgi:hypothetical protein
LGEELAFVEGAEGGGEQFAQPVGGGLFAVDGGQTDDAVRIGEGFEAVGTQCRAIGEGGAGLAGPAVAQQPGDGDLEGGVRVFGMPIEEPLGRVARIRLGQPLGVFLRGDFLPVLLDRRELLRVCNVCFDDVLVELPNFFSVLNSFTAITPQPLEDD